MAANSPVPNAEPADVARKVDEINRRIDAVSAANTRTKIVSLLLALAIIGVGVYGTYKVTRPFVAAYDDSKVYGDAIMVEFQQSATPIIEKEAQLLLDQALPFLGETVQTKFAARQDEITSTIHREINSMIEELGTFAQSEFASRRDRIENAILERIKEQVPELNDQANAERIMVNAQEAMSGAVERVLADHMHTHVEAISNIGTRLESFPVPEDVRAMSDEQLQEELANVLGSYAASAFRHSLSPQARTQIQQFTESK